MMAIVGGFLAFVVTLVFMFTLRPLATAVGLVDIPGGRKRHYGPVPLTGGIAMSLGLGFGSSLVHHPDPWNTVLMATYMLVTVGTIDDRFDLPADSRLIAQTCAALLVTFGAGIVVTDLGSPQSLQVPLGFLAAPFTVLFIVTVINGYNVIDGLDGLAGGLSFLALVALAIIGHGTPLFAVIVALAAAVAAFLMFNLPFGFNRRARAFMGDAGSTALGFAIACIGIVLCQGAAPLMSPVMGLWLIAVPVFDLFSAVLRRVAEGKSPFAPDHEHLHHALVMNGLSHRSTLVVMLAIGVVCVAVGTAGYLIEIPDAVLLIGWIIAGFLYYRALKRPQPIVKLAQMIRGTRGAVRLWAGRKL
jgi:UDP-GlcNAc:undecaprenyl-phosphate GlcNAc-1-phosphate transferase